MAVAREEASSPGSQNRWQRERVEPVTDLDAVWAPVAPSVTEAPEPEISLDVPAATMPEPRPSRRERRTAAKRDVMRIVGHGLTIFGLVVLAYFVYLVAASRLEFGRTQRHLTSVISSELSTGQAPIGGRIVPGTPVALLEIRHMQASQMFLKRLANQRRPIHLLPLGRQIGGFQEL